MTKERQSTAAERKQMNKAWADLADAALSASSPRRKAYGGKSHAHRDMKKEQRRTDRRAKYSWRQEDNRYPR